MPEAVAQRLRTITAQALLLRDVIDGILEYSRLEAGVLERSQTEADLAELAAQLVAAFADQARIRGLALTIDLPAGRLGVNLARLRQVLVNLIGNALTFTPAGRVQVRGTLAEGPRLRIEVQDDGIGIPAEALPRLFREFSQVDGSHARSYGGTGLGLAICRRIVEGLGGRIGVDSAPGRGSLFWFELPVTRSEPAAKDRDPDPVVTLAGARAEVLVAEDTEVNLEVIRGMLEHLGHSVRIARNGREAVEMVGARRPDLVLMDMQMPVMDGLEATRQIRRFDPSLPIVGVTANALAADERACRAAGMTDFLPKPITMSALRALPGRHAAITPAQPQPAAAPANPELAELAEALGAATLLDFVATFEAELEARRATLVAPVEGLGADAAAVQNEALHSFKGAALTLGLTVTGQMAQRLRGQLPIAPSGIELLVAQASADAAQARRLLAARMAA
jgi:CheY-like chemotaxis protein